MKEAPWLLPIVSGSLDARRLANSLESNFAKL